MKVFDAVTLKELRTLTPSCVKTDDDESSPDAGPFFSPDGRHVAAPTLDRKLAVWDVASGVLLWEAPLSVAGNFRGGVFTADGRTVALDMDGFVLLLERTTGKERRRLGSPQTGRGRGRGRFGRFGSSVPDQQTLASVPNGRTLASAGRLGRVLLWDVYGDGEPVELSGHTSQVRSLLFAPDGKRLASGSEDTTALVWDVSAVAGKLRRDRVALTERETLSAWDDLGGETRQAFGAVCRLAGDPKRSVPLLAERLRPVPPVADKQIEEWVKGLDHRRFAIRRKARTELEKLGGTAVPALKKAAATSPSAEVRKAARELLSLATLPALSSENLRVVRAVEVLERAETAEAKTLLKKLAAGASGAVITVEARAALARLSR